MTVIDLIPPEIHAGKVVKRRIRIWTGRLVLFCVAATCVYIGLYQQVTARESDLQQLSIKYAALQQQLQHAEYLLAERERLVLQREAIGLIRGNHTAGHYMEQLGYVFTPDSFLTSLDIVLCAYSDFELGGQQIRECPNGLKIIGQAPGHGEVGLIIRQMAATQEFGRVDLISISETKGKEQQSSVAFELMCTMRMEELQ